MNFVQLHQTWPVNLVLKKTDLLIIHKPNLTSSHFKKHINGHGNQRPEIELVQAFMPILVTATLMMIRSKMNELTWRHNFPILSHSRTSNSKESSLIKLIQAFMPILVTSNFDDDSIKNERASMETANSVVSGPIWPKFELVRDVMHVLVTCKYKKDRIKNN